MLSPSTLLQPSRAGYLNHQDGGRRDVVVLCDVTLVITVNDKRMYEPVFVFYFVSSCPAEDSARA